MTAFASGATTQRDDMISRLLDIAAALSTQYIFLKDPRCNGSTLVSSRVDGILGCDVRAAMTGEAAIAQHPSSCGR